jgi:hypothetical protein
VLVDGVREPGESTGRLLPQGGRRLGVSAGPAQLGHQRGQGQRPTWSSGDGHDASAQLRQEPGRLVALPLRPGDGGHHQPSAGAGAGDVEQATLFSDPGRRRLDLGQTVRTQAVRLQQRPAPSDVGPRTFLDTGHHHQVPLQPLGAVGRQQPDRRTAQVGLAQCVGRDLLSLHLGQEPRHPTQSRDLFRPVGDVEQGADRVQVTVGPPSGLTADRRLLAQALGPTGARPEHPQRLLRRTALGDAPFAPQQQGGQSRGTPQLGPIFVRDHVGDQLRVPQRGRDQLARRPG